MKTGGEVGNIALQSGERQSRLRCAAACASACLTNLQNLHRLLLTAHKCLTLDPSRIHLLAHHTADTHGSEEPKGNPAESRTDRAERQANEDFEQLVSWLPLGS